MNSENIFAQRINSRYQLTGKVTVHVLCAETELVVLCPIKVSKPFSNTLSIFTKVPEIAEMK